MDKIVSGVKNIKLYSSCANHFDEINEKYEEYLQKLLELDPTKLKYFIQTIKNREIVNNQETEFEESFLIELYKLSQKKDSIGLTMKHFNDGDITPEDIKKIHRLVIKGSSDDLSENFEYRRDNEKWVGSFGTNGNRIIDYLPPDYNEVTELIDETLKYLNEANSKFDNVFLKPLIVHALIAYIQPFGNGNTRLARVLQHCKICTLTNKKYGTSFSYPTLYLSKNYLITRSQYRGLIKEVAINKDDESWNSWFNYNLNMIDEQLFFLNNQLTSYKKHF